MSPSCGPLSSRRPLSVSRIISPLSVRLPLSASGLSYAPLVLPFLSLPCSTARGLPCLCHSVLFPLSASEFRSPGILGTLGLCSDHSCSFPCLSVYLDHRRSDLYLFELSLWLVTHKHISLGSLPSFFSYLFDGGLPQTRLPFLSGLHSHYRHTFGLGEDLRAGVRSLTEFCAWKH